MADVFSWIETCKNMYQNFQVAYNVFTKVVTNFRDQRCQLKEEADFLMNSRVKNIEETVSTQTENSLTELKKHLQEIGKVFEETVAFLEEVKETQSGTVTTFLLTLLGRYRSYQQRFKHLTEKLNDLGKKLDQLLTDVIPKVLDLSKQLLAQMKDVQRDMKEMRKLLEKEKMDQITSAPLFPHRIALLSLPGVPPNETLCNKFSELENMLDKIELEVKSAIEGDLKSINY